MEQNAHIDLATLFKREFPRLTRSLTAVYGHEIAVESVQDAFLAAQRAWPKVARYEDPAGWVRRVALRKAANKVRNVRRRREILDRWGRSVFAPPDRVDTSLDPAAFDLRRAVSELPEQMRLSIALHYLADLSVEDVALALDVSTGTVKSNLHDARRRLRESALLPTRVTSHESD